MKKYIRDKKLISGFIGVVILLAALWSASPYIKEVSADAWFTAEAHIINDYINGCYYCSPPKAPTSMQILLHGGGNFDGATNFQWDCDNDGVYEGSGAGTRLNPFNPGDGTIMIEWWNGWSYSSHAWNIYGGGEWQYWYGRNISCSYNTGGQKRVNVIAERGGRTVSSGTTFNIQERTFNFSFGIPANGDYKPPYDDRANTGVYEVGTPAPTNVDLGIGMRENGARYQDDSSFRSFDTGFTYEVDCDGDGQFDDKSGSSNSSSFRIFPGYPPTWNGATFADNICYFANPGYYHIGLKLKDPAGKEHVIQQDVYIRSTENIKVQVFPAGETPGAASYAISGPQTVNLSYLITGLVSISTGSYNTTVDCGNGQTTSGPGENGRNYTDNKIEATTGSCTYSQPGVYVVKAKFQEYKPASEAFPAKSGEGQTKIIVTGESGGVWTVISPFSLEWDVSRASSCSITGLNDNFSATGLPAAGTRAVPKVSAIGSYDYRISCVGTGGTTEQTIKLNVVEILP